MVTRSITQYTPWGWVLPTECAIGSTHEMAAGLMLMEGLIAIRAKAIWLRVHPEASYTDKDTDTGLPESINDVLMAVLEVIPEFEVDGLAVVDIVLWIGSPF